VLLLTRADVESLLDLDLLIDALGPAMVDLSRGRGSAPGRMAAVVAERDAFAACMAAYSPGARALAAKVVTVFPGNAGGPLPTHQAVIVVIDPETGTPAAVMDGTYITAMRTAAGSALATRVLADGGAEVVAVIGTGVQAHAHALLVPRVRPVREVRIAGRDEAAARSLAARLAGIVPGVRAAPTFEEAVRGADVVCETTHSPEPVLQGEWLRPGAHVTSVGYNPAGRQLDDDLVRRAAVVVESRAAALAPFPSGPNDLLEPLAAGMIDREEVAEIGEIIDGRPVPRGEVTLYKSVGVAAQDAVAASLVLDAARAAGAGLEVALA
jgi:alanine dehydrogenase